MANKVKYTAQVTYCRNGKYQPPCVLSNWELEDTYKNILKWVWLRYDEGADAVELEYNGKVKDV
jgi:hypothetical protein